jgi:hypothetical protein
MVMLNDAIYELSSLHKYFLMRETLGRNSKFIM